jgi:multicomponent Na+:H+ antiporter subunit E
MVLLNVLLALIWAALTGQFTPVNLIFGFLFGYLMLWMLRRPSPYFLKLPQAIAFVLFVVWALTVASIRVAYSILLPMRFLRPGIVAVPLEASTDAEITLLANLITLTPGTLTLDVSTDRRTLYVHAIHVGDPEDFRRNLKASFERRVIEVLR